METDKLNLKSGIFSKNGCKLNFLFCPSGSPKKLIFFFPGAYDRSKGVIQFQRHSWAPDYTDKFHCIFLSDPTINENNDLTIGWFQGWHGIDLQDCLKSFIFLSMKELNIQEENIIFFGSSAGGFVSLKISESFPKATVIAINPQLQLSAFYPRLYKEMLNFSYHGESEVRLRSLEKNEFLYSPSLDQMTRGGRACIFQNCSDLFHLRNHLEPMMKNISIELPKAIYLLNSFKEVLNHPLSIGLNVYYYQDEHRQHNPPDREDTKLIIRGSAAI